MFEDLTYQLRPTIKHHQHKEQALFWQLNSQLQLRQFTMVCRTQHLQRRTAWQHNTGRRLVLHRV
jgi:hypothetical protein